MMDREKNLGMVMALAVRKLTDDLSAMEKKGLSADRQMNDVVWPVLNEVQNKVKKIKNGEDPEFDSWPLVHI